MTITKQKKTKKFYSCLKKIVANFSEWLDDLSDDEYFYILSLLTPWEKYDFDVYVSNLWDNFTRKRAFYFFCGLFDERVFYWSL
jgi:hypothetical protein